MDLLGPFDVVKVFEVGDHTIREGSWVCSCGSRAYLAQFGAIRCYDFDAKSCGWNKDTN